MVPALRLTMFEDRSGLRAWKEHDWDTLDRAAIRRAEVLSLKRFISLRELPRIALKVRWSAAETFCDLLNAVHRRGFRLSGTTLGGIRPVGSSLWTTP